MKRPFPLLALLIAAAGCHSSNPETVLVPPGTVVRLAEPVQAKIDTYRKGQWVESDNQVTIPRGYYFGPPPSN